MPAIKPIHLLRYGLPGTIALAGVVFICIDPSSRSLDLAVGITLIGIAIIVFGVNIYARLSIISQDDRDREEAAREYLAQTGDWPSERPRGSAADRPAAERTRRAEPGPRPSNPVPDPHADPRANMPRGEHRQHPTHRGRPPTPRRRPRR